MNPKTLPLVAAFLGLTANAASVTYTTDLPEVCVVQTCPDNRTFEVPRFNGSMGTLTGVTVVFTVTATDRFGMENVCLSQPCTGIARADWTAKLCAGSTVLATSTIHDAVAALPGVENVEVELTFDPPWTPDRMSEDAKFILGFG